MLDDLLNLSSEEYYANKSFAEDLTEGKFSFPIVWAIAKDGASCSAALWRSSVCFAGDNRILSMLRQRTEDNEMKRYESTHETVIRCPMFGVLLVLYGFRLQ